MFVNNNVINNEQAVKTNFRKFTWTDKKNRKKF